MNPSTKPFSELYPEHDDAHRMQYLYGHKFLPAYVWTNAKAVFAAAVASPESIGEFFAIRWSTHMLRQLKMRGVDDPVVYPSEIHGRVLEVEGHVGILLTLPDPVGVPNPFMSLMVAMRPVEEMGADAVAPAWYFALERSDQQGKGRLANRDRPPVVGAWNPWPTIAHHYCGTIETVDEARFIDRAAHLISGGTFPAR